MSSTFNVTPVQIPTVDGSVSTFQISNVAQCSYTGVRGSPALQGMPATAGSVGEQSIPPPVPMVLDFSGGAIARDHASAASYHVHDRPATISRTRTHAHNIHILRTGKKLTFNQYLKTTYKTITIIYGGSTWATSPWAGSSYAA